MFERCDEHTMAVFNTALAEARRLGYDYVGTEHLLVALVRHRGFLPDTVAALLPRDARVVTAALERVLDGAPPRDAELLKTLGIDLDEVRSAVRHTFGDDAIERLRRPVRQPWQPWRHPSRRCMSLLAGGMGVLPRVKQAFEHARRDADRRQRPAIDPAGLLLLFGCGVTVALWHTLTTCEIDPDPSIWAWSDGSELVDVCVSAVGNTPNV
jgi:Clp amino terminal domain, pathogenicity island component